MKKLQLSKKKANQELREIWSKVREGCHMKGQVHTIIITRREKLSKKTQIKS